jgi:RHS repeat-associated protein
MFWEPYTVTPFNNPLGEGNPISIVLRSNRDGTTAPQTCIFSPCTFTMPYGDGGDWISFEIAGTGTFPVHPMYIEVHGTATPEYVPVTFRKAQPDTIPTTPFVGGYRNLYASFWNERDTVFTPTELLDVYTAQPADQQAALDAFCAAQPACQCDSSSREDCEWSYLARAALMPVADFNGTPLAGSQPAYVVEGADAFVNSGAMNASFVGGGQFGGGALPDGGLFDSKYLRLSGTSSKFIGVDVGLRHVPGLPGGLSGSVGESDTNTTTDLVDMNGDGVLDVVAGDRTFVGHISPTAGPQLTGFQFGDGFRRRTGYDYSISLSGTAATPLTTAGGRALLMLSPPESPSSIQYDTSAGLSMSRSQETQDLIDINGDGLPDVVSRSGTSIMVQYNLGNQLGAPEVFGTLDSTMAGPIDGFQSVEGATDLDSTSNALSHESTLTQESTTTLDLFFAKFTKTTDTASNRTVRQLVDLNGDGLPDLVMKKKGAAVVVEYNRGGSFGSHKSWATPVWTAGLLPAGTSGFASQFASMLSGTQAVADVDVLAGSTRSFSSSRAAAVNVPLGTSGLSLGLSYTYHRSFDAYELALVDINGDGAPDHVLRKAGDPDLHVKINQNRGQANLLTTVHRPLGGTITLTYDSAGNTTSMPHRRQVLTHVNVDDGVDMGASYASPTLATSFNYAGGVYSRNEKQFLGFTTVTTTLADNGGSIMQIFANSDVRNAGNLLTEIRQDASGNVLSTHSLTYETLPVKDSNNATVAFDPACVLALPDLLQRESSSDACKPLFVVATVDSTTRYEGGVGKTRTISTDLDQFGNVVASVDSGDDQISSDNTKTTAKYKNFVNATSWLLGRPTQVMLLDGTGTTKLREREGGYNASYTELKAIFVETGSSTAETDLGYDAYGNVDSITTPKNLDGKSQTYSITFDAAVQTYPVKLVDAFGEMSTATYDVRYGVATLETDVSGSSLVRTLDTYGRLASVTGPYDLSGPGITMEYHPETSPPSAITVTHPSAPADYTATLPSPITAVTFVDGFAQPIELRKTSNVGGVAGMTTSGAVSRDLLGRVSSAYQPTFAPGPSTAFVIPAAINPTVNSYDALGRTTLTTLPDGHTISTVFDTGKYTSTGPVLFRTTVTDPNGHHRETYADIAGRTRAFVEHPTASKTSLATYDYTPAGDLSKLVDAEGNTTSLQYDLRGLRTTLLNDDTGPVTDVYDDMGNRIKHIDATHAANGSVVYYDYDRDRLSQINYPSKPQVAYTYEDARLAEVTDETGAQSFEYGALGEKRRVLRTIKRLDGTTVTFDTHFTTDSLGRQLQVVYPDGTTISNTYDDGGALAQVTGSGSGWSKVYADEIQYDVFGNRTHMRFGNNVETTWTYEPQRIRLSTVTTTLPSGPNVQQLVYGYDAASNPLTINNSVPALTASSGLRPGPSMLTLNYDDVDQLVKVHGSGWVDVSNDTTYDEAFEYTPSHNIDKKERTHNIASLLQTATSFDSTYKYASGHPHLPSSVSSATGTLKIIYDPSGNPIERDNSTTGLHQTLTWDDDNRLSTITASTYVQTNTYDAFGIRALRDENSDQTLFANQYFDLAGTNGGEKYVFAGDMRVATVLGGFTSGKNPAPPTDQGTPYYLHPDYLGSTAVVTTDAGDAQESHDYFVDGEAWVDHTSATPVNGYLFEGKPYDKLTGFYDYGQRFYDPRTSLWLGEDPAFTESPGKAVGRPIMLAVSAFSDANPSRFMDPDGRETDISVETRTCSKQECPSFIRNGATNALVLTPGAATRAVGGLKVIGGYFGGAVGATLCGTLIGCAIGGPLMIASADVGGAGMRQMVSGKTEHTVLGKVAGPTAEKWEEAGVAGAGIAGAFRNVAARALSASGAGAESQPLVVTFGRNANQVYHAFRHVDEMGLARAEVQGAIEQHVSSIASQIPNGAPLNQIIEVAGQRIQYSAYRLPDGTINVGRIHGVP